MFALLLRQLLHLAAVLVLLVSLNKDQVRGVGWRLDYDWVLCVFGICDLDSGYTVYVTYVS